MPPRPIDPKRLFRDLNVAVGHEARAPIRGELESLGFLATQALLDGLTSASELTRWEAVNLLGVIAPPDAADAVFSFALEEEDVHARWRAFWAVTCFDRASISRRIRTALKSKSPKRKWRAALIASMLGVKEASLILVAGLAEADPWIRWEALTGIKALGAEEAEGAVGELLAETSRPELRHEATLTLGCIGTPSAFKRLGTLLHDEDPGVRWRAAMSLGRWGPEAQTLLAARARKENDPNVKRQLESELKSTEAV